MFYPYSLIPFVIFSLNFLFPISNANSSVDDKMLIAFMKGVQKTKISEFTKQKYEAYIGILYFMRINWQCDKIAEEFKEYERTECQKYRKYLDILYEYLIREYIGIPTVKPKFVFKEPIEIEGPLIYAVNCLVKISQFYLIIEESEYYEYKLNKMFNYYKSFEPKLLNEERLIYEQKRKNEQKLSINEMILQLAIDTANECQTNENLDEIIRQNCEKNFEEYLEEMLKKAEERAKKDDKWRANEINDDKHKIIVASKFDDQLEWREDALFLEFVKGLATNFEKIFKIAKEYSIFLSRKKEEGNISLYKDRRMVSFGLDEIEKMKEHLTQKYESYLGIMYLMRENWHCEKIGKEFNEKERTECQKYRKYLIILYEYFFRLFVEAKNPKVSKQFPPLVKPIFIERGHYLLSLIGVVDYLNGISKCFWQKGENELSEFYSIWKLNLVNIDEINCEIKAKIELKAPKTETEIKISELRKEFEGLMANIFKNAKENAKEAKDKLEKAKSETEEIKEKENLKNEYYDKFGTFDSSPFS